MSYELQRRAIDQGAADHLAVVLGASTFELHELSVGELRRLMALSKSMGDYGYLVLAASLHIDGKPITLQRIDSLPGRLSSLVGKLIVEVYELHGLGDQVEPAVGTNPSGTALGGNGADPAPSFRDEHGGPDAVRPGA